MFEGCKRIGILGATGYIGRSLLFDLSCVQHLDVVGFSRNPIAAQKRLGHLLHIEHLDSVLDHDFDVLVNATGIGSPKAYRANPAAIFAVTESVDALLLAYARTYPRARIISLSSGAVYGAQAGVPISEDAVAQFVPNALRVPDFYALAKLSSEAKHRANPSASIVDLRMFSFFSRYVDITDDFLLSQVAACLHNNNALSTSPEDIVRDFVTTPDLISAISLVTHSSFKNGALDVRSAEPVTKFELLNACARQFGLRFEVSGFCTESPTGAKNAYYSLNESLQRLGFRPSKTSLQGVSDELNLFFT